MSEEKSISLPVMSWKQFLESCPPGRLVMVPTVGFRRKIRNAQFVENKLMLDDTDLELYCSSPTCDGVRLFAPKSEVSLQPNSGRFLFLAFECRNCRLSSKVVAVRVQLGPEPKAPTNTIDGQVFKLGEFPPFGPHTPSRVITLIKPDLELFLKGRRAESQGMGIGAFAYYRRVVENQKDRLLDGIKRAAQRLGASPAAIALLDSAKTETQFGKAVEMVKDAVPQALKIDNHNPLTLLHTALSKGLHAQTDEACLELATDVRVVLADLAERLEQATRDDEELKQAVARLHLKATEVRDAE